MHHKGSRVSLKYATWNQECQDISTRKYNHT